MDIFLLIIAALCIIIGFIGSILPVLPGPVISWVGLFLLNFTDYASISNTLLVITAIITLVVFIVDFILPSITTKKFGGSKAGERGALVGTFMGVFIGPIGVIIGPFIGAFIGEYIVRPKEMKNILKVAFGSFVGFLLSTGIKLIWCGLLCFWFVKALI